MVCTFFLCTERFREKNINMFSQDYTDMVKCDGDLWNFTRKFYWKNHNLPENSELLEISLYWKREYGKYGQNSYMDKIQEYKKIVENEKIEKQEKWAFSHGDGNGENDGNGIWGIWSNLGNAGYLKIWENEESGNIWKLVKNEHILEMGKILYFGKIGKMDNFGHFGKMVNLAYFGILGILGKFSDFWNMAKITRTAYTRLILFRFWEIPPDFPQL